MSRTLILSPHVALSDMYHRPAQIHAGRGVLCPVALLLVLLGMSVFVLISSQHARLPCHTRGRYAREPVPEGTTDPESRVHLPIHSERVGSVRTYDEMSRMRRLVSSVVT